MEPKERNNLIFLGAMGIFITSLFLVGGGISLAQEHNYSAMIVFFGIIGIIFLISLTLLIYQLRMKYKESHTTIGNPAEESDPLIQ